LLTDFFTVFDVIQTGPNPDRTTVELPHGLHFTLRTYDLSEIQSHREGKKDVTVSRGSVLKGPGDHEIKRKMEHYKKFSHLGPQSFKFLGSQSSWFLGHSI
jgi:hypothetical protein